MIAKFIALTLIFTSILAPHYIHKNNRHFQNIPKGKRLALSIVQAFLQSASFFIVSFLLAFILMLMIMMITHTLMAVLVPDASNATTLIMDALNRNSALLNLLIGFSVIITFLCAFISPISRKIYFMDFNQPVKESGLETLFHKIKRLKK